MWTAWIFVCANLVCSIQIAGDRFSSLSACNSHREEQAQLYRGQDKIFSQAEITVICAHQAPPFPRGA